MAADVAGGEAGPSVSGVSAPVGSGANAYQLTLLILGFPVPAHFAFNALAAGCIALLGRPGLAAGGFFAACIIDTLLQIKVSQWSAASQASDEAAGLRRLALLSFVRICVYVAPPLALALDGTLGGMAYLGAVAATLVAVALATGVLSPLIFWAMMAPPLAAMGIAAVALLDVIQAAAVLVALVGLYLLLVLAAGAVRGSIAAWHLAFNANLRLIPELEAAREAARRADDAKSSFLATMSHELRTPMNGLLGMAELLRREARDPVQIERLEILLASGAELRAVLDDIQNVTLIGAGPTSAPPEPASADALPPLAILAVDDNAVNLTVLEQLLGAWGHEIVKAQSGQAALALAQDRAFDLVLMDIQMPGLSGIETLVALRASDGASRAAPVIALTADVTSGGREHYLALGFADHAAKPIEVAALTAAMVRALATD